MDDEALVDRMRSGDLHAASALLGKYQNAAYTAALRLLGDPADAEDIAQETLVRGFTHISELEKDATFGPWIRRIAINRSLNFLRRRGLIRFQSLDTPARSDGAHPADFPDEQRSRPEERTIEAELRAGIEAAILRLPPEQRVAVVLRDMYQYDMSEIAELQRCGLSAAKMRVFRGREALRRILGASHAELVKEYA